MIAASIFIGGYANRPYQRTSASFYRVSGGGTTITCNQSSTNSSDFRSDLSAISNGQTLCLTNAVDYGTFTGTTKNITIVAQSGSGSESPVNATLSLDLASGDNGTVVIDGGRNTWNASTGLNIPTASFATGAANLTIKDFEINGTGGSGRRWVFDPAPVNSNILIDHFNAHDVVAGEALFYVEPPSGSPGQDTGITIQRGIFHHLSNDGIKLGGDFVIYILNNKFTDFHERNGSDGNHTDEIQPEVTKHVVIKGNWFTDGDQCLFGDDGTGALTITHNVIDNCGQWTMYLGGDGPTGSTIAYNTITDRSYDSAGGFTCGNNAVTGPFGATMDRSVPDLRNNIFQAIYLAGSSGGLDCQPVANHHNMLRPGQSTTGTGGSNFTGAQTYVGGRTLSSFDEFSDFCLSPRSRGYKSATDGGQVGACGGDYNGSNYGPPTGEGY
jgi:Right handed beta helix region